MSNVQPNTYIYDVTSNTSTPIKEWSKIEVRGVIRFPRARGENQTESFNQLVAVYGNIWVKKKNEGL